MHPSNSGSEKIVRTRPPFHVSRGEVTARFGGKSHSLLDFWTEVKKYNNNNKADSFFRLIFNAYIDMENRERARARDKRQRRPISLEE